MHRYKPYTNRVVPNKDTNSFERNSTTTFVIETTFVQTICCQNGLLGLHLQTIQLSKKFVCHCILYAVSNHNIGNYKFTFLLNLAHKLFFLPKDIVHYFIRFKAA